MYLGIVLGITNGSVFLAAIWSQFLRNCPLDLVENETLSPFFMVPSTHLFLEHILGTTALEGPKISSANVVVAFRFELMISGGGADRSF